MINVQPKLGFETSANATRQEAPKPAGSFSKDMKDALTRSTQEAPKSTNAAKIESKQISESPEKKDSDVSVSDADESKLQEEINPEEIALTGENVLPLVELPIVQADIELSNEDIRDEQIVEQQSKTLAFVPKYIIRQSESETVADHTVAADELSMEQQNTIEGVLNDIEHSVKNTQRDESVEMQETESTQTENQEVKFDSVSKTAETDKQENTVKQENKDNNTEADTEFEKTPNQDYTKQNDFTMQPDFAPRKVEMEFNPEMQSAKESVEFSMKFLKEVKTTVAEGKSELFIQLKPEHLGGLSVKLSMTDEGLTAKLITSNKEVHAAMNNQLFIVQDVLKSKDIDVVSMEVIYEQPASFDANLKDESRNNFFQSFNSNFKNNNSEETITINATYNSLMQIGDTDSEAVEFMA